MSEMYLIIENIIDNYMAGVHTALPGKIESYDKDTRRANVKPLVQRILPDGTALALPICTDVPVWSFGTEDAALHIPLKKGDGVMLIFMERSIEEWLKEGNDGKPSDPRRFSLCDAVAIPGLKAKGHKAVQGEGLEILYKDCKIILNDSIKIDNSHGKIEIASGGTVTINDNLEVLT
jgi:hypothetical protein